VTALRALLTALLPVGAALLLCGMMLLAVGVDPIAYYGIVLERGLLTARGLQESITRAAPLLLIAASLIVSFRAGLWNLGVDGQFLIAAVLVAAACPLLDRGLGPGPALLAGVLIAPAAGAAWAALPAALRAWRGINEIIATLMMSFLGVSLANTLIKLAFQDPGATVPQTRTLPVDDRLPRLFGSTVHLGVPLALVVLLVVHVGVTRSAWGLRLRTLGANARAARHVGIDVPRLTFTSLLLSGGLAGLAGGIDILGVWGTVRADWNPAYGLTVIPVVFLARLDGWAAAGLVGLLAMLSVGSESAAVRLGVPSFFNLLFVAMVLLFIAIAELLRRRRPV
jgi:general nucleoside transport system permease protein